ncbi:hypothetical protein CRG98_031347 [Punica granatum]|uniref:Uncharacterized protein n=1 Tax=Punica granatum TaxID=22663 RepID=A0A2I0IWB0_PUNGR|nr:hypothetical protein CRG98_031347 [Punica granatum]
MKKIWWKKRGKGAGGGALPMVTTDRLGSPIITVVYSEPDWEGDGRLAPGEAPQMGIDRTSRIMLEATTPLIKSLITTVLVDDLD